MSYRHLGRSGLMVSALSFGSWVTFGEQLDEDLAYRCMTRAFDAGVNFFDNAEVYAAGRSEEIMGTVLQRTGWNRSEYVVSTKIFWGGEGVNQRGLSRKHLVEGTNGALKRLGLDYVDLLFCHRPDIRTPVLETVQTMSDLIRTGKALYWGTSEWPAEKIREAYEVASREHLIAPTMEQPQYNMLTREKIERDYLPLFRDYQLGTTIWSPLASGILTGKYDDGIPEGSRMTIPSYAWLRSMLEGDEGKGKIEKARKLAGVAKELSCTRAQLALAWCLRNPNVSTVITGASKPEQVTENMMAIDILPKLTDDLLAGIEEILDNRPAPATDWRDPR